MACQSDCRLWVVTRHGQAVRPWFEAIDARCGALVGLTRVVMAEHPELRCTLVDVDSLGALHAELAASETEGQVAWREGRRWAPRLLSGKRSVVENPCAGGDWRLSVAAGRRPEFQRHANLPAMQLHCFRTLRCILFFSQFS